MTLTYDLVSKYVTVDGRKLRYIDAGSGRPLVLVHALSVQNSADQWLSNFEALSQIAHVYALDVPGWGLSDMPESGYDFPMWVGAVKGLCDALDLDVIDLMGQSLGGWIAALYAHQNPARVRRLALLSNAGLNPTAPRSSRAFALPARESLRAMYPSAAMADVIYDQMARPGREAAYVQILDYINDPQVREEWGLRSRLPEMQMPILFGQSDVNRAIEPRYALEGYDLAPHGRMMITFGGSAPGGYNTPELVAAAIRFFTMDEVPKVK